MIVFTGLDDSDRVLDKFVKDSKRTEARLAATYSKLASLENFQRIALNHEQRQRRELFSTTNNPKIEVLDCKIPSTTTLNHYSDMPLGLRYVPLRIAKSRSGSQWSMKGTQTRPHQNFKIVPYSSTASVCLRGHNRACRIAAELHQQLLSERSSRRQISAAALGAGVRAANAAKTLATVAQSRASSDRRFAQRDALQEAQKYSPALSFLRGAVCRTFFI